MMVTHRGPAIIWGATACKPFSTPFYAPLTKAVSGTDVPLPHGGTGPLYRTYELIEDRLEMLRDPDTGKLKLFGHSEGGLIAVIHAARHANTEVMTAGSPHDGLLLCDLMALLHNPLLHAVRDMGSRSRFMREYREILASVSSSLISVSSTHDKIVHHRSSRVDGAHNILVVSDLTEFKQRTLAHGMNTEVQLVPNKLGHLSLIKDPIFIQAACDFAGVNYRPRHSLAA